MRLLPNLGSVAHEELLQLYKNVADPTVTRADLLTVLWQLRSRAIDPKSAQLWAAFLRWGVVPSQEPITIPEAMRSAEDVEGFAIQLSRSGESREATSPDIGFRYEEGHEEAILDALGELEEADCVDSTGLENDDIDRLIKSLQQ
jgi:hypothetical protein